MQPRRSTPNEGKINGAIEWKAARGRVTMYYIVIVIATALRSESNFLLLTFPYTLTRSVCNCSLKYHLCPYAAERRRTCLYLYASYRIPKWHMPSPMTQRSDPVTQDDWWLTLGSGPAHSIDLVLSPGLEHSSPSLVHILSHLPWIIGTARWFQYTRPSLFLSIQSCISHQKMQL